MKKVKIILKITAIISLLVSLLELYYYAFVEKNEILYLIGGISGLIVALLYLYLSFCSPNTVIKKSGILFLISFTSLFSNLLVFIMSFISLGVIFQYKADTEKVIRTMIIRNGNKSLNNVDMDDMINDNSISIEQKAQSNTNIKDIEYRHLAYEYKRVKLMYEENLISEADYKRIREDILNKMGLDSSKVEDYILDVPFSTIK